MTEAELIERLLHPGKARLPASRAVAERLRLAKEQLASLAARGDGRPADELHREWNERAEAFPTDDLGYLLDEALEGAQAAGRKRKPFHFTAFFLYLVLEWCHEELEERECELTPAQLASLWETADAYLTLLAKA